MNKTLRIILGSVLIILITVSFFSRTNRPHLKNTAPSTYTPHATKGANQQIIDPEASLVFTLHARCRMSCRHITEQEIREVLRDGHINEHKSNPSDKPCPTYAIEDQTNHGQHLRIVFATCGEEVKVVTCIDLDHDYTCDCN